MQRQILGDKGHKDMDKSRRSGWRSIEQVLWDFLFGHHFCAQLSFVICGNGTFSERARASVWWRVLQGIRHIGFLTGPTSALRAL